jgi:hypothetical protein
MKVNWNFKILITLNTRFWIIVLLTFFGYNFINGQINSGLLPAVNFNKSLKARQSLNFKNETRFIFTESPTIRLNDVSVLYGKKIGVNHHLALGCLGRYEENILIPRVILQYSYLQKLRTIKLTYRLVNDYTFETSSDLLTRLRFRLMGEIPLAGQELNDKEFYLKIGNEYLNGWRNTNYTLEIRGLTNLGFELNSKNKIELGIDYRYRVYPSIRTTAWLSACWYVKI